MEESPLAEPTSVASDAVTVVKENSGSEQWSPSKRTIFGNTDPALIEPPAVRVVPEPLLVNDDLLESSSKYGGRTEQLPPAHSFLIPAVQAPDAEKSAADQPGRNGRDVLHAEIRVEEESERIPTGPLPSREALSEIPFLSPPPEFHQAAVQSASAGNAELVDAIVRKVLERIEPQLHELLSKDLLKPIVENILQNGNRKTDH
jgi:hypothetical protein